MLNIFKSATVATVADPQTETLVSEFIANGGEITKETTTAKKRNRKAKAAAPVVEAPVAILPSWGDYKDTTAAAPVVAETAPVIEAAPDLPETAALIWNIPSATVPAKKPSRSDTTPAAARKAALAETDKTDRLERVIALMTRPEGASLKDIQTCYWLAAAAVRRIVEKAGYTTYTSGDRGSYRYHARKA
jgi:hypothetical protein